MTLVLYSHIKMISNRNGGDAGPPTNYTSEWPRSTTRCNIVNDTNQKATAACTRPPFHIAVSEQQQQTRHGGFSLGYRAPRLLKHPLVTGGAFLPVMWWADEAANLHRLMKGFRSRLFSKVYVGQVRASCGRWSHVSHESTGPFGGTCTAD